MTNAAIARHLQHTAALVSLCIDFRLSPAFRATERLKLIVQNKINQSEPDLVHNGCIELARLCEHVSDPVVAKTLIEAVDQQRISSPCLQQSGDGITVRQCAAMLCQNPDWNIGYSLVFALGDLHRVAHEHPPLSFDDKKALDMRVRVARYFEAKGRSSRPSSEKIATLLERAMRGDITPLPKKVVTK